MNVFYFYYFAGSYKQNVRSNELTNGNGQHECIEQYETNKKTGNGDNGNNGIDCKFLRHIA